ncbi:MAG: hypothetical protein IKV87_07275 [Methanobrevibacter sp.]|nr:hypothetical protein [Methanobrevibacter sp.]
MDGMEIINSFKKEKLYEFSEAIPILNDEIYLIFQIEAISIEIHPNETKASKLKKLIINDEEEPKNFISHINIEPIAYLLKNKANENENENEYTIEAINKKYKIFVEKNKDKLLNDFLNQNK